MGQKVQIRSEYRYFDAEIEIQKIGNPVYDTRGTFIPDDEYVFVNFLERCQVFWPDGGVSDIVVGGNQWISERKFQFNFIFKEPRPPRR